jgi:hypothetical protein
MRRFDEMKTLGNLFFALGIVALGLPTVASLAFGNGAFAWIESLGDNNPPVAIAIVGGSFGLIVLGIIVRNIGGSKAKRDNKN